MLCLLVVLLPVRSWAWTGMAVQTAMAAVADAAPRLPAAAHGAMPDATPPCHAHSDAPMAQAPLANDAQGHSAHPGCTLCDLCHAGVLPPLVWVWPGASASHGSAPGWVPASDTGRQDTDGPFRPPRG